MGIFDWLRPTDINKGVEACRAEPGAVLLDVRTPQEYCEGRIPGSRNIPLQSLGQVEAIARDKGTPLFVYCYSGARSRCAVGMCAFRKTIPLAFRSPMETRPSYGIFCPNSSI